MVSRTVGRIWQQLAGKLAGKSDGWHDRAASVRMLGRVRWLLTGQSGRIGRQLAGYGESSQDGSQDRVVVGMIGRQLVENLAGCCRANSANIRQLRPDFCLGFQVEVGKPFHAFSFRPTAVGWQMGEW